jgi:N-acetylmuramoyl-L-alanine amidase
MQNVFQEQSTGFASKIQNQFKNRAGRIDRGVKQDGFWVLYMTSMPSVLIETGFITNPDEEKYLISNEGQDYLASAIYRALRDYITEVDKKSRIQTSMDAKPVTITDSSTSEKTSGNEELLFMIQVASSAAKKEVRPENFRGIKEVIEISAGDRFRYATGSFVNYSSAVEYRKTIEAVYPDAFIIAIKSNKILPLQDALNLKKTNKKPVPK